MLATASLLLVKALGAFFKASTVSICLDAGSGDLDLDFWSSGSHHFHPATFLPHVDGGPVGSIQDDENIVVFCQDGMIVEKLVGKFGVRPNSVWIVPEVVKPPADLRLDSNWIVVTEADNGTIALLKEQ